MRILFVSITLIYLILVNNVSCLFKNLISEFYCKNENCYSILGVSEKCSINEIRSAYHRHLTNMKNNYDSEKKKKIVKAYNVLANNQTRKYYDYYLKYPNSFINVIYFIFYCVYKLIKVIIALVIIGFLLCAFQYMNKKYEMKRIVQKLSKNKAFKKEVQNKITLQHPDYRNYELAIKRKIEEDIEIEVAQQMGLINNKKNEKFSFSDLIIVKVLLIPKHIICYVVWNVKWLIKYNILNDEYDESDKMYITRKCLNISADRWNALSHEDKKILLKKQLWVKEIQNEFFEEQKEKERINKISSAKYKKQMRMKKKGCSFNYND
ncbi:DnaJ protein [Plasmodium gonderi]|uniref:DnaJ protein n=1 Tax=Plasmodium gonderi TaxID=77519 RepID=A0A1Y1JMD5_PLAGO|nr:DnaJ protein [Plasmodium gonderi]GAW81194.1 DnaJ protein [Plasmodium gonderi]